MHNDDRYRNLTRPQPNGQSLWVHLLYGPSTVLMPGLLPIGLAGIAEELDWSVRATKRVWEEIAAQGMAKADWRAPLIWLPKALKHNPPQNPNVVRAWRRSLRDDIPPCALKAEAENHAQVFLQDFGKAFLEAFMEGSDSTGG